MLPTASTCGPTLYLPIKTRLNGCSFNLCTWIWFSLTHVTANLDYGVLQLAGCGYVLNIKLIMYIRISQKTCIKIVHFISLYRVCNNNGSKDNNYLQRGVPRLFPAPLNKYQVHDIHWHISGEQLSCSSSN